MINLVLQEIEAVARARNIDLPHDVVKNTLDIINEIPPDVQASMQRDILEGWPSELGSQTGAVVRMGLELGVATPVNSFIYNSLLPQELKARGELSF
jgi:2-dehydropantoate 2-reductase